MDSATVAFERAINALCYDGYSPEEIAELARLIALRNHAQIDDIVARKEKPVDQLD